MYSQKLKPHCFKLLGVSIALVIAFFTPPLPAAPLDAEDQRLLNMNPVEILGSDLTSPSLSKYWEEQGTTSVSKKGEDPFNTPAAVYIISSEDIRRSGVTSVMEALRMAPGIQVARIDANKWAITARGFNFQFSKRILVLIDGQDVINPLISGVFWDEHIVPIEDVDRIEVIRGPGSVTWGTNAVNGVINIITKSARDTQGGYISALYGTEEKGAIYGRYGKKSNNDIYYRTYVEHKAIDSIDGVRTGRDLKNGFTNSQAGFRVDGGNSGDNTFLLAGNLYTADTGYLNTFPEPPLPFVFRPENKNAYGASLSGKLSNFTDKAETTLQSYLHYSDFTVADFEYKGLTSDLDFQQTRSLPNTEFTWGAGYRLYYDETTPSFHLVYDPSSQLDNLFSAFIQNKFSLMEDKVHLTLGSRFEYHDKIGFEPQPTARISYNLTPDQMIWTALSRVSRFPTRGERNISRQITGVSPFSPNAFSAFGKNLPQSHMTSDKTTTYEIGYKVKPLPGILFDFTSFYSWYRDLITYTPTLQDGNLILAFQGENRGRGESYGYEAAASWQATSTLRILGSYSFIDIKMFTPTGDITGDITLDNYAGAPGHQFNIQSQYNFASNIEWDNSLYYVSSLENVSLPGYTRFDTRLAYKPIHGLELSLVGQNLLDDVHQEFSDGYLIEPSEIGRSVYAKAAWEF
jgi:iron complex outermembrane receptor protein